MAGQEQTADNPQYSVRHTSSVLVTTRRRSKRKGSTSMAVQEQTADNAQCFVRRTGSVLVITCRRSKQKGSTSMAVQELSQARGAAPLQERVVGTAEHCLGLLQGVRLVGARLLTHFVVLNKPIALRVQGCNVLVCGHQLLRGGLLLAHAGLQGALHLRLRGLPVGQGLRVCGALGGRVGHGRLVVLLRVLFFGLGNRHLLLQVLHQQVHHGDATTALL
mmetsp:Transcript_171735/g.550435  ORF Transcript_171735/g.550435 Transcript_171735/m.550435 type:complete len:219 (+) Transcript_171735:231-887(+)